MQVSLGSQEPFGIKTILSKHFLFHVQTVQLFQNKCNLRSNCNISYFVHGELETPCVGWKMLTLAKETKNKQTKLIYLQE